MSVKATVNVLPVVHCPDISCRAHCDVGLHLQATTHVSAGRRNWSPVFMPGGQFSVFTPHSCTIGLLGMAKLEIQILSLPFTATAQGPGRPPPVNGEPGYWLPSGRNNVTLPPSALVCLAIARVN